MFGFTKYGLLSKITRSRNARKTWVTTSLLLISMSMTHAVTVLPWQKAEDYYSLFKGGQADICPVKDSTTGEIVPNILAKVCLKEATMPTEKQAAYEALKVEGQESLPYTALKEMGEKAYIIERDFYKAVTDNAENDAKEFAFTNEQISILKENNISVCRGYDDENQILF